ncbi:MAG: hypothetical protein HFI39_15195 [Lachnospiraceae bacterium]|nr:hypothetical protein [Lachnospiraceae bacterium]
MGAVTVMNDDEAENLWKIIVRTYSSAWDMIEEEAPDETDLLMLAAIKNDPECHEFSSESAIDWDLQ